MNFILLLMLSISFINPFISLGGLETGSHIVQAGLQLFSRGWS